jgi:hypothetical protein
VGHPLREFGGGSIKGTDALSVGHPAVRQARQILFVIGRKQGRLVADKETRDVGKR